MKQGKELKRSPSGELQENRPPKKKKSVAPRKKVAAAKVAPTVIQSPVPPSSNGEELQQEAPSVEAVPQIRPRYGFVCDRGEILITTGHGVEWQISEVDFRKSSKKFAAILDDERNRPIHLSKKDLEEGKSVCWTIELIPNEYDPSDMRLRTLRFFVSAQCYAVPHVTNLVYIGWQEVQIWIQHGHHWLLWRQ